MTGGLGFLKAFSQGGSLLAEDASLQWITVNVGVRFRLAL